MNAMKKTPDINPESQNIAELQAMVKTLVSEKKAWQQERQSLIEQFKLALERQFAKRSEALTKCRITTVAMESTSVYWVPYYRPLVSHDGIK